jgi:hypothetical protein
MSKYRKLSAVMRDFGHRLENTLPRTHTIRSSNGVSAGNQAHFRLFTRPLDRHFSQFHAAGDEN